MQQIVETDADACNFIGISRADAAPGRIDAIGSSGLIFHFIQNFMIWHNNMSAIRDKQVVDSNRMLLEIVKFGEQILWIDGGSSSHNADAGWIEDTARNQVQLKLSIIIDNGMAGIAAALEAHAQVAICTQQINEFAFPFIAPLCADNNGY